MKVLLLSAYAAQSHVYWQECLGAMFDDWQWRVLCLPPRYFSWRVRGNPLYWALEERQVLEEQYDLLIATSMVDLATLRGLVPHLATLPSLVYFHENQFSYPVTSGQASGQSTAHKTLVEAQMVSIYSALAADSIVFNSNYNRSSFMAGCDTLLRKLPDKVPAGIVPLLQKKSSVVAVPLNISRGQCRGNSAWNNTGVSYPSRALRIVWVGRFEYDKGGDRLLCTLQELEQRGLKFELAVVGQQFRASPEAFAQIADQFKHRLVHFGYIESRANYQQTLVDADIILSTAIHEFQGLALLEAITAGCIPVVPDRVVYPEIISAENCYSSYIDDISREAKAAAALVLATAGAIEAGVQKSLDVSHFSAKKLKTAYRALFEAACTRS